MLSILALSTSALAGDLAVRWDAPVAFHAEAVIDTPRVVTLVAAEDREARAIQLQVAFDLDCAGAPARKGWDVTCEVANTRLAGTAVPSEQARLDAVLAEYTGLLDAGTVEVAVAPDGRLTSVDLEGVSKKDARQADAQEALRQIVRRAISPLDAQLPKDGVDPGKAWRQTGTPLALEMLIDVQGESLAAMSGTGVAGGADLKTRVASRDGAVANLETTGTGTILVGESGRMVHMSLGAEGRFDAGRGAWLYRYVVVDGLPSAASSMTESSTYFRLAAAVGLRHPDGRVEGPAAAVGKPSTNP